MAMLSDRTGEVAAKDENADGRVDQQDDRIATRRVSGEDATTIDQPKSADGDDAVGRAQVDERLTARRGLEERTATATKASTTTMPVVDATDTATDTVAVTGPRPRASFMATLSLILGVVAAVSVLTGLLAGPGVAVGLLAAIVGLAGVAATSRRHVAGKSDAFLGIGLGLASIVLGVLALTGNLPWLNGDTDMVARLHGWFAAQLPWLLP